MPEAAAAAWVLSPFEKLASRGGTCLLVRPPRLGRKVRVAGALAVLLMVPVACGGLPVLLTLLTLPSPAPVTLPAALKLAALRLLLPIRPGSAALVLAPSLSSPLLLP